MNAIEALQPVTHIFQIFGLSVATSFQRSTLPFDWIIKCYSLLLNTLRIAIFAATIITQTFFVRDRTHAMYAIIDIILVCGVRLLEIVNSVEAFFKVHHEKQLMKNFMEIDNILMHRFNVDLKSNELRPSATKRLFIWLFTVAFLLGGNLLLSKNQSDLFFFYLTYIPPFVTASLTYLQIIIWADLIRYRLHVVNRLINHLNDRHNEIVRTICNLKSISRPGKMGEFFESSNDARIFNRIRIICDLHRRLWIQTNLVNERFKCSMVLNIGNEFVSLVANLYFTFISLKGHLPYSFIKTAVYFMNSVMHVFHISMLSRTCHHAFNEASNIAYGIHNNKYASKNLRLSSFVSGTKNDDHFQNFHIINSYGALRFRSNISRCNCFIRKCVSVLLDSLTLI